MIKIQNDKQNTKMINDSVIQNEKSLEKKIEVPNKIMDPIDTENKTNDNLAYNNLHISNFLKDKNIERIKDIPSQNIDQISIKKLPNDNENVNNDGIIQMDSYKIKKVVMVIFICLIGLLLWLVWIAKFVLSLILYHFIESGDIEKYNDFLDCRGINNKFFDKFSDIKKLKRCVLALAILDIISECFDKIGDCMDI